MAVEKTPFRSMLSECRATLMTLDHLLRLHLPTPIELPTGITLMIIALNAVREARESLGSAGLDDKDAALLDRAMLTWHDAGSAARSMKMKRPYLTPQEIEAARDLLGEVRRDLQEFMASHPCDGHSADG